MERRKFIQGASLVAAVAFASQAKAQTSSSTTYINVMDYGATGNGSTDDSGAFKSAIAALQSANGGTLLVPAGKYLLKSTVNVTLSNMRIQGEGAVSWIINGQASAPAIQFGDGANSYFGCGVFDLTFGQAAGVSASIGNAGLSMLKVGQSWVERCSCIPYPASLYTGFYFNNSSQMFMTGNQATSCMAAGYFWTNNCLDMYLTNSRSDASGIGFHIQDSAGFYFTNAAGWNNGMAWSLDTAGGGGNSNLFFTNCIGDTSGSVNWNITSATVAFFADCWGSTQQNTQVNTWASGFYLNGTGVRDISFSGGTALYNNSHGMTIDGGATNIQITGFQFGSPSSIGTGNGRSASGGHGLFIGNATGVVVDASLFAGNHGYGLNNGSGVNVDVAHCTFTGNATGPINGNGTASSYRNNRGYNPVGGNAATPSLPTSGAAVANATNVDCSVYLTGSISNVSIDGQNTGLSGSALTVFLPAGSSIAVSYSGSPTWKWLGH